MEWLWTTIHCQCVVCSLGCSTDWSFHLQRVS